MKKMGYQIHQFGLFLILVLGFAPVAQARLDIPTANLNIVNAVPMHIVTKIALTKARETWGPGALGDATPLSDLNGDVVIYMFPYHINGKTFPTHDEILKGIKEGRELQKLIDNHDLEKTKEKYNNMDHKKADHPRTAIISNSEVPQRLPIDSLRPDGSPSKKKELQDMMRFASKKAMGADEFGTIFVSATYDRFPVTAYFHYLAPYYINFDLALEKAEQDIGPGAFLDTIYFLGLEGQFMEFMNNGSTTLLNSKTFEKHSIEKLKESERLQPPASASTETFPVDEEKKSSEISNEWEKVLSEIGGE